MDEAQQKPLVAEEMHFNLKKIDDLQYPEPQQFYDFGIAANFRILLHLSCFKQVILSCVKSN
jgi:hypothetical protein